MTVDHHVVGFTCCFLEEPKCLLARLARDLALRGQELDHGEFLEVLTVPLAEAVAMTRDGRVTDVKTIVGLHWAQLVLP